VRPVSRRLGLRETEALEMSLRARILVVLQERVDPEALLFLTEPNPMKWL
jgi:hypothetical protein